MKKLGVFLAGFTAALVVLGSRGSTLAEERDTIVVVVNKENPARSITREELRPLFQTTKTEWPDGAKAIPVNLPEDNPVRQKFDLAVLGLDPDRVERYWIDRKIRGGERPPRRVLTPGAALQVVSSNKGGVGYMVAGDANDSVRVVAKISNGKVIAR